MSIEAIDSILNHILDAMPETPSCLCDIAGLQEPCTPQTLDDMVDHLVSGALSRPPRPVAPASAGACVPCAQARS